MATENKTAVDWLFERMPFEFSSSRAAFEIYQQAKELERQQTISSYKDRYNNGQANWGDGSDKAGLRLLFQVLCYYQSFVLYLKFSDFNPRLRKASRPLYLPFHPD